MTVSRFWLLFGIFWMDLLLFNCSSAYGQKVKKGFLEGYIVSFSGDSTPGYVRPGNLFKDQQKIRFYDYFGHRAIYSSDRIAAYGYAGKDYISRTVPFNYSGLFSDSTLFLLRMVDGPAKLYRFYTRRSLFTLQKGPAYFDLLQMPDGKMHEVSYNFKWKRIAELFTAFPELAQAIRDEVYKPEETPEIVQQYNEWYRNARQ